MAKSYYQYETSPRKYEPDYTTRQTTRRKVETKKISKQEIERRKLEKQRIKKAEERKRKTRLVIAVLTIFGMLLAVSYREISIMEMFNQKKAMEEQLAVIEKENGQVEKSIKEVESTLDWNKIKQIATEQLGMEIKSSTAVDLEKVDNVETENTYIKPDNTSTLEKIVGYFIKDK